MTKRERKYIDRLAARRDILKARLRNNDLRDPQDIQKELNALEWAIDFIAENEQRAN